MSTFKHLKPEDTFCAAGFIKAYLSWISCTCLGYSLTILQASINFDVNITHFDKVIYVISRERDIDLHRHISLKFAHYATWFIS